MYSYAGSVAQAAKRWTAAGGKSAYVPALCHGETGAEEYDGFDGIGPVVPDLMERRAALWSHNLVKRLIACELSVGAASARLCLDKEGPLPMLRSQGAPRQ